MIENIIDYKIYRKKFKIKVEKNILENQLLKIIIIKLIWDLMLKILIKRRENIFIHGNQNNN